MRRRRRRAVSRSPRPPRDCACPASEGCSSAPGAHSAVGRGGAPLRSAMRGEIRVGRLFKEHDEPTKYNSLVFQSIYFRRRRVTFISLLSDQIDVWIDGRPADWRARDQRGDRTAERTGTTIERKSERWVNARCPVASSPTGQWEAGRRGGERGEGRGWLAVSGVSVVVTWAG